MEKLIYFTYDKDCRYCDMFSDVAERLNEEYTDNNFVKLKCEDGDNKLLAKRIFGVKQVPSVVVIKDKKIKVLSDISSLKYDDVISLIKN